MRCQGMAALGEKGTSPPPRQKADSPPSPTGKDLTATSLLRSPSLEAKLTQGIAQQLPQSISWAGHELLVGSQIGLPPALVSPGGAIAIPRGSLWLLSSPALQRSISIPPLALQPGLPWLLFPSCFSPSLPSWFPHPVFLSCFRSPWG